MVDLSDDGEVAYVVERKGLGLAHRKFPRKGNSKVERQGQGLMTRRAKTGGGDGFADV